MSGSNQWIDRLLCLTCGETFDQDTRLNVERKAAAAARAVRPALAATPAMSSTQAWLGEGATEGLSDVFRGKSRGSAEQIAEHDG